MLVCGYIGNDCPYRLPTLCSAPWDSCLRSNEITLGAGLTPVLRSVERLHTMSRWAILVLVLCLPLILVVASGIRIGSASAHAWLPEGRAERSRYEAFVNDFGSDQYLVASWPGCTLDDPRLDGFTQSLDVLNATSDPLLASHQTSAQVIQSLTSPPLSLPLSTAKNRLLGSMIGEDGTAAVFIRFTPAGVLQQKRSIELVRQAADRTTGMSREDLRMVGSVYEGFAVDEAAEQSLKRLVLPSSLLGIVLAWFCLRSVRAALTVLMIAGLGQLIAVALVTATGGEFSAVLIVLPTLVFMLTLSAAVHFMNYYSDVAYSHRERLGARAILLGLKPSVLATLTTALGMAALATSQLAPVRTFGLYSAITLCLATVVLIFAFPQLADWLCQREFILRHRGEDPSLSKPETSEPTEDSAPIAPWAVRYAAWVAKNTITICVVGIGLILFSFYGLLHLKSSTKFDDMFPKQSLTVQSMAWIEKHLGPIASVEVLMVFPKNNELPQSNGLDVYQQVQWVDRVTNALRGQPDIGGVVSATTFLPKLPTGSRIRDVAKRSVLRSELNKSLPTLEQRGLVADQELTTTWRITAKVSALSKLNYGELTDKVRQSVENIAPQSLETSEIPLSSLSTSGMGAINNGTSSTSLPTEKAPFVAEYTGLSPIMHDTQLALLDDLGSSFTTAFFLITPVMMLIARGIRAGLLIMIPNVLPETIVFGSMAWLGYSIDIAGILTASVAMGIAVNDTLHFVNWYSRRLAHGDTREQAIADTFSNCAKAMVHTMLISCCSMVPFLFADFNPTRQFAILMISMMSSSILGDLILLPALLLSPLGKPRRVEPAT